MPYILKTFVHLPRIEEPNCYVYNGEDASDRNIHNCFKSDMFAWCKLQDTWLCLQMLLPHFLGATRDMLQLMGFIAGRHLASTDSCLRTVLQALRELQPHPSAAGLELLQALALTGKHPTSPAACRA